MKKKIISRQSTFITQKYVGRRLTRKKDKKLKKNLQLPNKDKNIR